MPGSGMPEINYAAHDRVRLRAKKRAGMHDWHDVGGNVENVAHEEEGPGPGNTLGISHMQVMAASGAHGAVISQIDFRDQIAGMAAAEAELRGSDRCSSHESLPTFSQISSGLKARPAATSTGIKPAKAHMAVPVST